MELTKLLPQGTVIKFDERDFKIDGYFIFDLEKDKKKLCYLIVNKNDSIVLEADRIDEYTCSCCNYHVNISQLHVVNTIDYPDGRAICSSCLPIFESICCNCATPISFDSAGEGDSYNTCSVCCEEFCDECVIWNENDEPVCKKCSGN